MINDPITIRIENAAMNLMIEKGYSLTTTKEIAKRANVNECTLFRKFAGKKDIVLQAMRRPEWNPDLKESDFESYTGVLMNDLYDFAMTYMTKVTPDMVMLSIGLRCPELFSETSKGIMNVPKTFKEGIMKYFKDMIALKKISTDNDIEALTAGFISMTFGYIFFQASFGNQLFTLSKEEYIKQNVKVFVQGIITKS
jgi:AcrR family transcriptional regulator